MFYHIENNETSPYYNLALEQAVFDRLDRRHSYCMLWQNHNAVIVGKHQNTAAEINAPFVESHGIAVARRRSGGGAVYHDLGNVNFTFITDTDPNSTIDFTFFCKVMQEALRSFGVPAVISGRNDILIDGKKVSGNAQYIAQNRIMHHGTLLYDSDMGMLSHALKASGTVTSKGIKSVRSRVANIRPFMKIDMPVTMFRAALQGHLRAVLDMREYVLTADDRAAVKTLHDQVYSQWNWNYGKSPPYNVRKSGRIEGCGTVEILLDVAKEGVISNIAFYGDFFGSDDPAQLAAACIGCHLEREELSAAVRDIDISRYFHNMETETFLSLLL